VYVSEPVNNARTYVVKIQAPGYKPTEKTIQYGRFDSLKLDQKETVIPFDLIKVKSGDYIDFNNVHFIKDSPIMKPDSQNELDGLAALMKENPRYKIKIHGFCNGEESREIISRGSSDKFFELEPGKNKKHKKSAKELSLSITTE
jgi:outer membrane protein OmpA-like peptidoglycan-associated protein